MELNNVRAQRMLESAPEYYHESQVYAQLQLAVAQEIDKLAADADDLQKQLYIPTATWGLRYWEQMLDIPTITTDSYALRRGRVLSKRRGVGQFSVSLIKAVAESFVNGAVAVTMNIPSYTIDVHFIDDLGVPEKVDDIKAAIANIVHAHLQVTYTFTYTTFNDLDAAGLTFNGLDALGLTFEELGTWRPE